MATVVNEKKYLMDVVLIRLTLIFLLVFYHAFCIFSGAWDAPYEGFPQIEVYKWMALFTHDFRLQAMVFISGLLLGNTINIHPERLSFDGCVVKKIKRILLPCLIFSIIYYVIFYDLSAPWYKIVYKLLNGCGHLWFLPMIFWCFVSTYIIEKYANIKPYIVLIISVLAFFLPVGFIPFGIGSVFSYLFTSILVS